MGLEGWQWLFIMEAIPAVILGIICYFYLDDKIEDVKWLNKDEKKWLIDITTKEKLQKQEVKHYTFLQALKDRDVFTPFTRRIYKPGLSAAPSDNLPDPPE